MILISLLSGLNRHTDSLYYTQNTGARSQTLSQFFTLITYYVCIILDTGPELMGPDILPILKPITYYFWSEPTEMRIESIYLSYGFRRIKG